MWPKKLNKGSFKFLKIHTSEVHYGDRTGNFSSLDIKKKSKGRYSNSFLHNNEDTDLHFRVISHWKPLLARLCSKSFKIRFSSMWTDNFQMYELDLEKAEEPEIKLPISVGSQKKQGNSRKKNICFIDYSLWLCGLQQTWKFLKRWECQTTLSASWEICMQVKKQQVEPDMEQ